MTTADPALLTPPAHPDGLPALREITRNQIDFFTSTYAADRDVVRVALGAGLLSRDLYVCHSPAAVEEVLSAKTFAHYSKDGQRFYRQIQVALGDGILTAWGDEWLRQKRFIQPVFTRTRVESYTDEMVDAADELVGRWRDGGTVDLGAGLTQLTLRVVTRALFGIDAAPLEDAVARWFPALNRSIVTRVALPVPVPLAVPLRFNREFKGARDALQEVCSDLIARRRTAGAGGDDLASLLISARDGDAHMTDEEVRDQVLIFLLAGHETTSTALTFTLHLLGRHPEIQERVRAEVADVLGDARPTAASLQLLPYTAAVLKEAMRLYPSAPFTGRLTAEDSNIGGYAVPAGSDVVLSVWTIHRRPDLWPDPLTFDPTRFLGDERRNRYAWVPFGAGPRACIGQHFSMLESAATLAQLVRAFDFAAPAGTTDHLPVGSGITLYPLEPVLSEVTPLRPS